MDKFSEKLSALIGADFIEVSRLLAELRQTDPDQFVKVAASLGIGLRKAYYLVQVAQAFQGLAIPKERLYRVGWTKLQVISPYVTSKNVKKLLAQAEAHPVHELKALLAMKGLPPNTHCVLFYLSNSDFDLLAKVVEAHGGKRVGRTLKGKEKALVAALTKLVADL